MKPIHKNIEPDEFVKWKSANQETIDRLNTEGKKGDVLWDLLQSSLGNEIVPNDYSKNQLRDSLIKEQFYLCCYCNATIKGESLDTKIEHYLPKETYREDIFNYQNLLASCNGGERDQRPRDLHCDSYKLSKDPSSLSIVNPLDFKGLSHFSYRENGEIFSDIEQGKNTILFLNLHCKKLNLLRKIAIETYIYDENIDIKTQIKEVSEPLNGQLQAFCMAIVNVLENYK